jgi:hypothetical protein
VQDAGFYSAHRLQFHQLLSLGTCTRITFPRLIRDDTKLPHTYVADQGAQQCFLPLGIEEKSGDVSFVSLVARYFAKEPWNADMQRVQTPLAELKQACSKLDPPVQQHELGHKQHRLTSLPVYACFQALISDYSGGSAVRKDIHVSWPDSIDLSPFVDVGVGHGATAMYDLTEVLVHIGKGNTKQTTSKRESGRTRALKTAAASGHFVLYSKLNDKYWLVLQMRLVLISVAGKSLMIPDQCCSKLKTYDSLSKGAHEQRTRPARSCSKMDVCQLLYVVTLNYFQICTCSRSETLGRELVLFENAI